MPHSYKLLSVIWVVTMTTRYHCSALQLMDVYATTEIGETVEGSIVAETVVLTDMECARSCSRERTCTYYQHYPSDGNRCLLIQKGSGTIQTLESGPQAKIHKQDQCAFHKCENNTICVEGNNTYSCQCAPGYTGPMCETNIDECGPGPCQNNATCSDLIADYSCACVNGWDGKNCDNDIDECASTPCRNGGTCSDQLAAYNCTCVLGFDGPDCETNIDDCTVDPCLNGATCNDEINAYSCTCVPGYTGSHCEDNIDECEDDPCENGMCYDRIGHYECVCDLGFDGTNCDNDIDECASNPCQNAGTCVQDYGSYGCYCEDGFDGTDCETNIDECAGAPCWNGGTCNDRINAYSCSCLPGYTGSDCEDEIDECESNPCMNGASCNNLLEQFTCDCSDGFEGLRCNTGRISWVAPGNWPNGDTPVFHYRFEDASGFIGINGASLVTGYTGYKAVETVQSSYQAADFGTSANASCMVMGNCPNGGTVSVWIKVSSCGAGDGLMSSYSPGKTGFYIECESSNQLKGHAVFAEGQLEVVSRMWGGWNHYVMIFEEGGATDKLEVYLDAWSEGTASSYSGSYTPGDGQFVIGRREVSPAQGYSDVQVDELSFWNRKLNGQEAGDMTYQGF